MQKCGMIRYEKATNTASLMPLFFTFADELEKKADDYMKKFGNVQKAYLQVKTDVELSAAVSGLCRTIRSFPLVYKRAVSVGTTERATLIPCKTSYDLTYYYFPEDKIDGAKLTNELANMYSDKYTVVPDNDGYFIVDPSINNEITVQKPCSYEPLNDKIEMQPVSELETPHCSTIEDLAEFVKKPLTDLVKAVMYEVEGKLVFVNIRGDLKVSEEKLRNFLGIGDTNIELKLASPELLTKHGLVPGFSGLIGVKRAGECTLIADESIRNVVNGITGANKKDYHYINFNVARDTKKISKFIKYADVASNSDIAKGAIVAEVTDLKSCYPEMLGLDSKHIKTPMYKITIRLVDLVASLIGEGKKINGVFVLNVGKDEKKLMSTIEELKKHCCDDCIVVDNRPKANFGQKMQIAEISLFKNIIVVSSKLDQETVSVNDVPVKIKELGTIF